ncbi:hypothetical protein BABINDRAFT_177633 [Babjeviella inositovora NRRL Y-12698]|uniref:Uncharacterized protein n=1 Tax=Babjeviella inositovora NRRL Y-12698 TaxID=984486 RepID=A0A1E3QK35_9ASCO|nr:uncharacterized protein BABINDRAFT_177633 [Babjeviella inositovora NRRL Y-12698]ODQ78045.1 hypothetical protein BABINDRAFT_177633 [Babjeviella inositovora NRRL Y-12698]
MGTWDYGYFDSDIMLDAYGNVQNPSRVKEPFRHLVSELEKDSTSKYLEDAEYSIITALLTAIWRFPSTSGGLLDPEFTRYIKPYYVQQLKELAEKHRPEAEVFGLES